MSQQAQSLFISQVQGWGQESHDVIASMASPRMISSEGLGVFERREQEVPPTAQYVPPPHFLSHPSHPSQIKEQWKQKQKVLSDSKGRGQKGVGTGDRNGRAHRCTSGIPTAA